MVLLGVLGGLIVAGLAFALLREHSKAAESPVTRLDIK